MIIIMSQRMKPYLDGLGGRERHFHDGETLLRRGDPVGEIQVVLKGVINRPGRRARARF